MTCNIWKRTQGRISEFKEIEIMPSRWIKVIEKLHRAGVATVEVFGGDALLRKDIVYPLIQRSTELGMDTFFPTNAIMLDYKTAQSLVTSGLQTIYFSLDGTEELHDNIRGLDRSYKLMEKAIWNVYKARSNAGRQNPRIGTITTVSRMNAEKIEDIVSDLERFPLDFIEFQILGEVAEEDIENSRVDGIKPTPLFVSSSGESNLLSEQQLPILTEALKDLRKRRHRSRIRLHLYHLEPFTAETFCFGVFPPFPCHWCTTVVTLTPSADVVPCPIFTDYVLGNIDQEGSLTPIWGNNRHRFFLDKQRSGELPICRKCSMRHSYPGIREKFRQAIFRYL
jgi:radical SAM protein with 4Fe4S-binding SPASM domain